MNEKNAMRQKRSLVVRTRFTTTKHTFEVLRPRGELIQHPTYILRLTIRGNGAIIVLFKV